jgi:hypothetical protein
MNFYKKYDKIWEKMIPILIIRAMTRDIFYQNYSKYYFYLEI